MIDFGLFLAMILTLDLVVFAILEVLAVIFGWQTMSQYVIKRSKEGSTWWVVYAIGFPLALIAVGLWLVFHWEGLCTRWQVACTLSQLL